jgi:hypothetical protein
MMRIGYNRRMFQEALESRLKAIEEEITRLLKLSAEISDPDAQDNHLRLAQDLQREARDLRAEIRKQAQPKPSAARGPRFREYRAKDSYLILSE